MEDTGESNGAIALCLSGGGLRATLFHLGVVKALRDYEFRGESALSKVSEIYSVSGGSILAAHMLANWDRYTGSDDEFAEAEQEILRFAHRNLRDRILRRWLLTRWLAFVANLILKLPFVKRLAHIKEDLYSRTYWLQHEYDALLRKKCLCSLCAGEKGQPGPKGHILTTSFTTGELCSFSGTNFEIESDGAGSAGGLVSSTPCGHMRLSFALAASSAFPPMFPPVTLTDDMLANPKNEAIPRTICLSDGGVFDNLGIEKFLRTMNRNPEHPSSLLISDAGGAFRSSGEKKHSSIIARNIRASDILMERIGKQAMRPITNMTQVDDIRIRISTTVDDGTLEPSIQQRLRLIRTDLDSFNPELAGLLVDHGARVTRHALKGKPRWQNPGPPALSAVALTDIEKIDAVAGKASARSFWSIIFSFSRDWTLYLLQAITLLSLIGIICYILVSLNAIQKRKEAEGIIEGQRKKERERLVTAEADAKSRLKLLTDRENAILTIKKSYEDKNYDLLVYALNREIAEINSRIKLDEVQVQEAVRATEEQEVVDSADKTKSSTSPVVLTHPQKIYIQFSGSLNRETITRLNDSLKARGWNVQGSSGDLVPEAPSSNEVRYSESNKQAAIDLAAAISDSGIITKPVILKNMDIIGPNNLEVWVSH